MTSISVVFQVDIDDYQCDLGTLLEQAEQRIFNKPTVTNTDETSPMKKKPTTSTVQRDHYSNMVDYLEAKYVRGIQVDEDDAENDDENDDELNSGAGSVYSDDDSFINDEALKVTVAEQVVAHNKTKLQEDFFVNVGALELLDQNQDGFVDIQQTLAVSDSNKVAKKRKQMKQSSPHSNNNTNLTATLTKKKQKAIEKMNITNNNPVQVKADFEEKEAARSKSYATLKELVDQYHGTKSNRRHFTVPEGKVPGDAVMFDSPTTPGQQLKCNIPAGLKPGDSFWINLPGLKTNDGFGKLHKEVRDSMIEYARVHDEWVDTTCKYYEMTHSSKFKQYRPKIEKQSKYDEVVKWFPSGFGIDVPAIKKQVKQYQQHKQRMEKAKEEKMNSNSEAPKPKNMEKVSNSATKSTAISIQTFSIQMPAKGQQINFEFFDESDFIKR